MILNSLGLLLVGFLVIRLGRLREVVGWWGRLDVLGEWERT